MPWKGYNYEDAIVLNERMVREDILTSVHVDEYSLDVRETKRGMEELTSDIPNVSEDATRDLDERGIIRVGAYVVPGDIMIGKITPKGESDPTPGGKTSESHLRRQGRRREGCIPQGFSLAQGCRDRNKSVLSCGKEEKRT